MISGLWTAGAAGPGGPTKRDAGGGPGNGVGDACAANGFTGGLTIVSAKGDAACPVVAAAAVASEYAGNTDSWTATGIHFWPSQTHLPSGDIIGGCAGGEPVLTLEVNLSCVLPSSAGRVVKIY